MNKNQLTKYITKLKRGELVYQCSYCMANVLGDNDDPYRSLYNEKQTLVEMIKEAKQVRQIDNDLAKRYDGFNELAQWSRPNDVLMMVDDNLLLNLGCLMPVKINSNEQQTNAIII